jgi:hypothetical protein
MTTTDLVQLKPRVANVFASLTRPDMKEAFERLLRAVDLVEHCPADTAVKTYSRIVAVLSDEEDVAKNGYETVYAMPESERGSIQWLHRAADELNGLGS